MPRGSNLQFRPGNVSDTLSTGVVKVTPANPLIKSALQSQYGMGNSYRLDYTLDGFKVLTPNSDTNKAYGQKLHDFYAGAIVRVKQVYYGLTLTTDTGLAITAGVFGLGSVVGSGAVAVLSGTSTFVDLSAGVAITAVTDGTSQAETLVASGVATPVGDGAATKSLFLNFAGAWDQTAGTEYLTFTGRVIIDFEQIIP